MTRDEAIAAIEKLLTAMEKCHICGVLLSLDLDDAEPTHCENCSEDCEDHTARYPACSPMWVLHRAARMALEVLRAQE